MRYANVAPESARTYPWAADMLTNAFREPKAIGKQLFLLDEKRIEGHEAGCNYAVSLTIQFLFRAPSGSLQLTAWLSLPGFHYQAFTT
ncbi:hypothetical protein ACSEE7_01995 [Halomonas cupida]|uniref:hypothetical protein n=1 Tax=Halomonas cupida TaxID=44933 RepID=UPI003EF20E3D